MGLGPSQLAYFQAVTYLAWVAKPLWGLMSDALPIFGSRRKSYLILSSLCACLVWLCLSITPHYTAASLLMWVTLSYLAYAFQDVVTDGWMVEVGKPLDWMGRFQAVQWGCVYLAAAVTAVWGGYISELARKGIISYQMIFGITALFPLATVLMSGWLVRETAGAPAQNALSELRAVLKKRDLWILAAFLFFWNFSPSINAPFFYYAVDTLKFDGVFLGWVQAAASVAALIGSMLYPRVQRIPIRKFLVLAVLTGVSALLFTFVYFLPAVVSRPEIARLITVVSNGLFSAANVLIFLTLVNLAAKVCPQYAGGTTFALLMSFYNLGTMGSAAAGGVLLPIVGLKTLIVISAACSLLTLFFIPHLSLGDDKTKSASAL